MITTSLLCTNQLKRVIDYYYVIGGRKIEFLTVHKSKGLEANYVILLQCNKDTYGFPSQVSDDLCLTMCSLRATNSHTEKKEDYSMLQ